MTSKDGIDEYRELEALAKAGRYQEALEKHIWFHKASKEMPGMGGVRLSYALTTWLELSKQYSPALAALLNLKKVNRDMLLNGKGEFINFQELAAINRTLGEEDDTYEVFLEIHRGYPIQARRYYHVVENILVKRKEYHICANYITDAMDKYSTIEQLHKMNISFAAKDSAMNKDEFQTYANDTYVSAVCQLIEIMLAIGKTELAHNVKVRALEHFDSEYHLDPHVPRAMSDPL